MKTLLNFFKPVAKPADAPCVAGKRKAADAAADVSLAAGAAPSSGHRSTKVKKTAITAPAWARTGAQAATAGMPLDVLRWVLLESGEHSSNGK